MASPPSDQTELLKEVLEAVKALTLNHTLLSSHVDAISGRVNVLAGMKEVRDVAETQKETSPSSSSSSTTAAAASTPPVKKSELLSAVDNDSDDVVPQSPSLPATQLEGAGPSSPSSALSHARKPSVTSRIILTTYPGQSGINPLPMDWGHKDPQERGPVVVSRSQTTIRRRNAIGAHGGSYSIYYALAVASNEIKVDHRPDFTNTEPAANIGPFPQWADKKKIVSMDPLGHLAPWLFKDIMQKENVDIRPTIAITRAHMKLPELEQSVKEGRLVPDGKVCLNESGELAVTKFAVEPVWYLPGVAERFGIDEGSLRRSLFEHTGGSYPELITRGDIKLFLPPIGGLTVYCFGDPAKMSDEKVRLALRVHDECNGSDVFGSDICTCRPYLIYGIEEAVKEAQKGGSGVVIYFRKEGRALGEVTKYLVYNARKRGADRASEYFKRTENIAGVKDMRFQALMPDILHWLGIKKIDRMLSMSNMKHDAIVGQGIPIHERVELPESWIPADSRVEIDAKITAGYFTTGHRMTEEELAAVKGRSWEDIDH
ncbi:Uracil-regulated protein 1 [Cadophora gregata]|uniref:Uracil-regulated protein 1 n=1 Tax=Cadophora gregata TaxID=51156 RepID=UPI0026DD59AD|nr:Uracil-regulated protein 1 [Cadophora gregata]KAK0099652.1 Uracil-regulated protein 1 [Cadophora gregata f. sp. sojae]KAK0116437.1 Uracil-regulated protein 1 [Cadophora gregata]